METVRIFGAKNPIKSYDYDVTEMECLICHECLVHDLNPPQTPDEEPCRLVFERSEECSKCKKRTHTYCLSVWFNKAHVQKCPHCRVEVTEDFALQVIEAGQGEWEAKNWKNWKNSDVHWQQYYQHEGDDQSDYDDDYDCESESASEDYAESGSQGEGGASAEGSEGGSESIDESAAPVSSGSDQVGDDEL